VRVTGSSLKQFFRNLKKNSEKSLAELIKFRIHSHRQMSNYSKKTFILQDLRSIKKRTKKNDLNDLLNVRIPNLKANKIFSNTFRNKKISFAPVNDKL
jgi:hypothetical protein